MDVGDFCIRCTNSSKIRVCRLQRNDNRSLIASFNFLDGVNHALQTGFARSGRVRQSAIATSGILFAGVIDLFSRINGCLFSSLNWAIDRRVIERNLDVRVSHRAISIS